VVAQVRSSPIEDVKDENKKEERERSYGSLQLFILEIHDTNGTVSNERSEIYIWPKCNTTEVVRGPVVSTRIVECKTAKISRSSETFFIHQVEIEALLSHLSPE
jgi:hypothetical protein